MDYSPSRIDAVVRQIRADIAGTSKTWAADVRSAMQSGAPWNDRNGPSMTGMNARQSLDAEAGIMANGDIQIVARTDRMTLKPWGSWPGAPVGVFLELGTRFMIRRAIIWPTLTAQAPALRDHLQSIFSGE